MTALSLRWAWRAGAFALAGLALTPGAAWAQNSAETLARLLRPKVVENFHLLECRPDGTKCGPATAAERQDPPLSMTESVFAVRIGLISAQAQVCGLDWRERNFGPLMREKRAAGLTERQMAMLGALHGAAMGVARKSVTAAGCSPAMKKQIDALLR